MTEPSHPIGPTGPSETSGGGAPSVELPAVELRDIWKRFPGVVANAGASLRVRRGSVHAVLGENGAGKSTLMNVLSGVYRPDEGEVRIDGVAHHFRTPADALAAGVGMVHQEFRLVPSFTVAERKQQIIDGSFHPFQGPINAQDGSVLVAAGETMSDGDMLGIGVFVEGVVGSAG